MISGDVVLDCGVVSTRWEQQVRSENQEARSMEIHLRRLSYLVVTATILLAIFFLLAGNERAGVVFLAVGLARSAILAVTYRRPSAGAK